MLPASGVIMTCRLNIKSSCEIAWNWCWPVASGSRAAEKTLDETIFHLLKVQWRGELSLGSTRDDTKWVNKTTNMFEHVHLFFFNLTNWSFICSHGKPIEAPTTLMWPFFYGATAHKICSLIKWVVCESKTMLISVGNLNLSRTPNNNLLTKHLKLK